MRVKALFDTNVLLDAAMCERPGWASAMLLLDEIAYESMDGLIAAASLKDLYYVLSKYRGEAAAREYVEAVIDAFTLIATDEAVCRSAAKSDEPDFEDGIIRACAESANVDFIISRDETAFRTSKVRRLSPQEYVDLFCDVEEVLLD